MGKRSFKTNIVLALMFGWVALLGCIGIANLVYKNHQLYQADSKCVNGER